MTAEQLLRYIDTVQKNFDLVKKEELVDLLKEAAERINELVKNNKQLRDEISALALDIAFLDKRIG